MSRTNKPSCTVRITVKDSSGAMRAVIELPLSNDLKVAEQLLERLVIETIMVWNG